jgi:hypothetical protein
MVVPAAAPGNCSVWPADSVPEETAVTTRVVLTTEAVKLEERVPTGQYEPAGHGVPEDTPCAQREPAGHGLSDADVLPVPTQKPAAHTSVHADVLRPVELPNTPAGHGVGEPEFAGQKEPTGQVVSAGAPISQ